MNTAYEISTQWVKLRSQMQNKLQTWYWSIMPQAEQSRSAIFESKLADLEEWETTLAMISLLLICLITLTKCVSWNESCNINIQGRRCQAPGRKKGTEEKRHDIQKSHGAQKNQDGKVGLSNGTSHLSPLFTEWQSLEDQNTSLFRGRHFMVFSVRGKSMNPFAVFGATSFLQKHALVFEENNHVLLDPAGAAFESFWLRTSNSMWWKRVWSYIWHTRGR